MNPIPEIEGMGEGAPSTWDCGGDAFYMYELDTTHDDDWREEWMGDLEQVLSQTSVKYDIHPGLRGGLASSISLQASSVSRSFIGCLNS